MIEGAVEAIAPRAVRVRLDDGRVILAVNALPVRCPPRSRVVVATNDDGTYAIVGRVR